MKSRSLQSHADGLDVPAPAGWPSAAELAALRAWYEGRGARQACERYLGEKKASGQSSRAMISRLRRQLARFAKDRHQPDLAQVFEVAPSERVGRCAEVGFVMERLRTLPPPAPLITDFVGMWLPVRVTPALEAQGIRTLADLTVRVPRRRRWWSQIPGLGAVGARQVEAFFAKHPELTERARALVVRDVAREVAPWEQFQPPEELNGSKGLFRAPSQSCTLSARNDYEAVQAWLSLQESTATQRAYRKEAERLILWAVVQQGKAMTSLTTEDAVAYRGFLRHPSPRSRWVGPAMPRSSPEWKPFAGALSSRSIAYALSVLNAMFRWLLEKRYVLANPFAGIKVRGAQRTAAVDASRAFGDGEWALIRTMADSLEWSHGWTLPAAQRLRFLLDFGYSTGLRAGELVGHCLGNIQSDGQGDRWLHVTGKGAKSGRVALPPLACSALDQYLVQRGISVIPAKWDPATPLLATLAEDGPAITTNRLRAIVKRFCETAAQSLQEDAPALAEKLRRATPHWLRHTHASHALANGVELTAVRDNLRHSSISTTSVYLHADESRRARQMEGAFGGGMNA